MCFYNSMNRRMDEVARRYGRKSDVVEIWKDIIGEDYRVTAFTNPDYPIVTADPEVQVYKWGLIPAWVKTSADAQRIRMMTYNAKAETLFTKPSFRGPARNRRCLIPSTGWFEWRHEKGKKLPFFIGVKDEPIFSMAGVYDRWVDPDNGQAVYTFSLITTEANELMSYIHNSNRRMPALLPRRDEEVWLDPSLRDEDIAGLLRPFDTDEMEAYRVRNDFLSKNPHDPGILAPATA